MAVLFLTNLKLQQRLARWTQNLARNNRKASIFCGIFAWIYSTIVQIQQDSRHFYIFFYKLKKNERHKQWLLCLMPLSPYVTEESLLPRASYKNETTCALIYIFLSGDFFWKQNPNTVTTMLRLKLVYSDCSFVGYCKITWVLCD